MPLLSMTISEPYFCIDAQLQPITSVQYNLFLYFNNGFAAATDQNDAYGVIDLDGSTVIPFGQYRSILPLPSTERVTPSSSPMRASISSLTETAGFYLSFPAREILTFACWIGPSSSNSRATIPFWIFKAEICFRTWSSKIFSPPTMAPPFSIARDVTSAFLSDQKETGPLRTAARFFYSFTGTFVVI